MSIFDTWTALSQFSMSRRKFNPESKVDLAELAFFKKHSKWKYGCPFYLEWPYQDIVSMCQARYTEHMLSKLLNKEAP